MSFFKNIKIGNKILLVLLGTSLGALLVISFISYTEMLDLTQYSQDANLKLGTTASDESQAALQDLVEEYLVMITDEQSVGINAIFSKISAEISTASNYLEGLYQNPDQFEGFALPLPDETTMGTYCSKYMLAPDVVETDEIAQEVLLISNCDYLFSGIIENNANLSNIYVGTYTGVSYRYSASNAYDETYDPRARDWFKEGVAAGGEVVWLDTYVDSYGSIGITCAQAFCDSTGEIIGVVAADITLDSLKETVEDTAIGTAGYAFLIDSTGAYIVHPDYGTEGFDPDPLASASGAWEEVLTDMAAGNAGLAIVTLDDVERYVSYVQIDEVSWTLGTTVPMEEVIAPALETKEVIDGYIEEAQTYIQATLLEILMQFIFLFAICAILLVCVAFVLSTAITRPLLSLVAFVQEIGNGNLQLHIDEDRGDEVGELAKACNLMTDNLKENIDKLIQSEGEKERISTELSVASDIQRKMLPNTFPAFPTRNEFDIYATMTPAKEVGGDFYDFFLIDEGHLGLVMADVSGKGVPAALFMVTAKTLLKNRSEVFGELSPSVVLESVNNLLCEGNDAEMFVTVWFGILEIETGKITYANAGHEYPAIYRANGTFELLKAKHGFVLAGMEDMQYKENEVTLGTGDKLFLYTDGVPEATNGDSNMFGLNTMLETLTSVKDETLVDILTQVEVAVNQFVGDAPQFDDLTMLALHYKKEQ